MTVIQRDKQIEKEGRGINWESWRDWRRERERERERERRRERERDKGKGRQRKID